MEYTNNFWAYFPGGHYRGRKSSSKIVSDLDLILEKEGINGKEICDEMARCTNVIIYALNLIQDPKNKIFEDEIIAWGDAADNYREEVRKKIIPIFYKMLEKGYSKEELIR